MITRGQLQRLSYLATDRQVYFRLAVILGLVLAVIAVGFVMVLAEERSTRWMTLLIAAAFAVPIGATSIRYGRFEYGILGLVLAAGMANFVTLPTGTESRLVISLVIAMGLVAMWLFQSIIVQRGWRLEPSPINRPILIFAIVSVIAYGWSNVFRDPLLFIWRSFPVVQVAALAVNVLLPMTALLVANKINDRVWIRRIAWIIVGMGAFVIVSLRLGLPTDMLFYNGSSGLFATWVVSMALALALFNRELAWWMRGLLLALVGLWFYRNFVEGAIWLSGWVPIIVSSFILILSRSRKLFLVVLLLAVVYFGVNYDFYYSRIYVANIDEGGLQRLEIWETSLEHVSRHPLFGSGPAGYAVYYMTYNPQDARSTHNNYLDVLAQTGVIGFAAFVWMVGAFIFVGIRVRRALAGRGNTEEAYANATLAGLFAALVIMAFGDWVLPFAYNSTIAGFDHSSYTWVLLGGMVALDRIVRAENKRRRT